MSAASSLPNAVGINGSAIFDSTGDPRCDLSTLCVRGADPAALAEGMRRVLELDTPEALEDAAVLAFHSRNVRGGKGERDVFYRLFLTLIGAYPELGAPLLALVPEYGSWRDVFAMRGEVGSTYLGDAWLDLVVAQLRADEVAAAGGKSISLLAKWIPREHRAGDSEGAVALARVLFPEVPQHASRMRRYRQLVAGLNRHLATVETAMCAGRWADIKPAAVPGRAGKVYARAFLNLPQNKTHPYVEGALRHPDNPDRMTCREHFLAHFAAAAAGRAKVNGANTVFPHEIVKRAMNVGHTYCREWEVANLTEEECNQLNAVWNAIVEKAAAGGGLGRSIMMSDFSGSMRDTDTARDTPFWVSMALGILGSQVCAPAFRGRLMTFDSTPTWHTFPVDGDLFACLKTITSSVGIGTSTNFEAALQLVLDTLKEQRVRPGEEPENLIVLTDMGWDEATNGAPWETHVDAIRAAFQREGEAMWGEGQGWMVPRIVIWNLAASFARDFHATAHVPGVTMLSGWSPSQFAVLQKEGPRQMTMYETLRIELDDPQYARVREVVRSVMGSTERAESPEPANHGNGWGAAE
jgi:hypothetical protein